MVKTYNKHNDFVMRGEKQRRLLSDYFDWLEDDNARDRQHEFLITHLIHVTENNWAEAIGYCADSSVPFCFKPHRWHDHDGNGFFSWWSPVPPENWDQELKAHRNYEGLSEESKMKIGSSVAFDGESLYGPIGFAISWKDLLKEYVTSRGREDIDSIELRIFGTFPYKREVMFVILVCMKDDEVYWIDAGQQTFDPIESETVAFRRTENGDEFIWKVYATSNGWNPNNRKGDDMAVDTWDHLSFIFYFPNEDDRLKISPNLCSIKVKSASKYRTGGKPNNKRTKFEWDANKELVEKLEKKIAYWKETKEEPVAAAAENSTELEVEQLAEEFAQKVSTAQ